MPLIKKIVKISGSRLFVIPKSWLDYIEREAKQEIVEIAVEVDHFLTISPIIPSASSLKTKQEVKA